MFDYSTPFNSVQHRSTPNDRRIIKCIARRMSEYAAMIFAQSAKEPHEPQPRTARTATANRTNRNREPHEPQPQTARTATEPHVLSYF